MRELRPQFDDEDGFVRWIDEVQRPEGYRVVAVFEDGSEEAVAVAGFRVGHMLSRGRHLYVDDLSTLPRVRRRGYGRELLDWLDEEARREKCDRFHLDSGVEANRQDAHRLYFNTGLRISAYHFSRPLEK
jgi:GNAT superfamily N-acetyltransferase